GSQPAPPALAGRERPAVTAGGQPERDRRQRSRPSSVSVVVPAYNAAATLGDQLDALAAQQFEDDWELVVVDNGSTDGTAELARHHRRRFPAFTLVHGGLARGPSAPRNAGAAPPGGAPAPRGPPPATTTWSAGGWTRGP